MGTRKSISVKITALVVAVMLVLLLSISLAGYFGVRRSVYAKLEAQSLSIANCLVCVFGERDPKLMQRIAESVGAMEGVRRVAVVGGDLRILADSDVRKVGGVVEAEVEPYLADVLAEREVRVVRCDDEKMYVCVPLHADAHNGDVVGAVLVEMDLRQASREALLHFLRCSLLHSCAVVAVAILLLLGIRRMVIAPVRQLSTLLRRASAGDLVEVGKDFGEDEIGELFRAFGEMTENLRRHREAAERSQAELRRANRELEEKLKELEKFYRLTVGRELEMMKLKEKIKRLEEKLKTRKAE